MPEINVQDSRLDEVRNKDKSRLAIDGKEIRSVYQDRHGIFWFGSINSGLYRFDGRSVKIFTQNDGLSSNQIGEIQGDRRGNIYVMTSEGINKFDGKIFSLLTVAEDGNRDNQWILGSDDIWFRAQEGLGGVYRYDGNKLYFLKFPQHHLHDEYFARSPNRSFSPYDVYTIYSDKKGHVWFGTGNFGAYRFDGRAVKSIYEKHLTETPKGGSFGIRSIYEDNDGKYWFSNTSYRFSIESDSKGSTSNGKLAYKREPGIEGLSVYFSSALEDDNGTMWLVCGTEILRINRSEVIRYTTKQDNYDVTFYSLYKDRDGSLWSVSPANGLYKFNGKSFVQFRFLPSQE